MSIRCPLCDDGPTCVLCGLCRECHALHRALQDNERPIPVEMEETR